MGRLLRTSKFIVAYSALSLSGLLLTLQIPMINKKLTQACLNVALPKSMQAKISQTGGTFPFDYSIDSIQISDKAGVWLTIKGFQLSWRAIEVLWGRIHLEELTVASVEILRLPLMQPQNSTATTIPDLEIDHIEVKEFKYADHLARPLTINGTFETLTNHAKTAKITFANETDNLLNLAVAITPDEYKIQATAEQQMSALGNLFTETQGTISDGAYNVNIDLALKPDLSYIHGFINGTIKKLKTTHPTLKKICGTNLDWQIPFNQEADGSFNISKGYIRSDQNFRAEISGMATTGFGSYQLDAHLKIPDIGLVMPKFLNHLNGPVQVNWQLHGNNALENIKSVVKVQNLVIGNTPIKAMDISLDLNNFVGIFKAQINDSILKSQLTTKVDLQDGETLKLETIKFTGLNGYLEGALTLPLADWWQSTIKLKAEFKDLAPLSSLLNKSIDGDCSLVLTKQRTDHLNFDLAVKRLALNHHELHNLTFDLKTKAGTGTFKAQAKNDIAEFNAHGSIENDFAKISLSTFNLTHMAVPMISLGAPLTAQWSANKDLSINAPAIKVCNGDVRIDKLTLGQECNGGVTLSKLSLASLKNFLHEITIKGFVDGKFAIKGPATNPSLKGEIELTQIGAVDNNHKTDKNLSSKITFTRADAEWAGTLTYQDSSNSNLAGTFKVWDDSLMPSLASLTEIKLKGIFDLSTLNAYIWWGDRTKGILNLDCQVSQSLDKPLLKGNITLKDGLYENADFGTLLKDIEGRATLSGQDLTITSLQARDYNYGFAKATGGVNFNNLLDPAPHIKIELDRLLIANDDLITIATTGALTLIRNESHKYLVSGNITVNSGEVLLDDSVRMARTIKIQDSSTMAQDKLKEIRKNRFVDSRLNLDLNVTIPNNLVIEGNGIDSLWGGNLHLINPVNNVIMEGNIKSVKGKILVAGKDLTLNNSDISFITENTDLVPVLNLKAVKDIGEIKVFMTITGKATQPKVEFSSSPVLSQEEAISLLLFGKTISAVSAGQSLQLAAALTSIKSGAGGKTFLDKMTNAFGLDEIGLSATDDADEANDDFNSGNYGVRVGKHLGDRIYVAVDQGLKNEKETKITMQIEATKNTKINLERGNRSASIGYNWEKRY